MTNTKEALNRFRSLLDWVDDLSPFVTGVMRQFDELRNQVNALKLRSGSNTG